VSALVDKEFPAYDADKSGQLDKNEFSTWILALKADELKATGKTMAQTEMASWASAAFTSADTDKSTTVTKAELGKFLGG
jgi:Ca2+-binding EF-hand superfamily protein